MVLVETLRSCTYNTQTSRQLVESLEQPVACCSGILAKHKTLLLGMFQYFHWHSVMKPNVVDSGKTFPFDMNKLQFLVR